jgi:hypothetical protein
MRQLNNKRSNNEGERNLAAVPPKPRMMSETKLEVVGSKTTSEVAGVNKGEDACNETEKKRKQPHYI